MIEVLYGSVQKPAYIKMVPRDTGATLMTWEIKIRKRFKIPCFLVPLIYKSEREFEKVK